MLSGVSLFQFESANLSSLDPVVCRDGLVLRLFNTISDLRTVKEWMARPDRQANWAADLQRGATIFRYIDWMRSDRAQCFMVERDEQPLIQLNVFKVPEAQGKGNDQPVDLGFLYVDRIRHAPFVGDALTLLSDHVFSFPEFAEIRMAVPKGIRAIAEAASRSGFLPAASGLHGEPDWFVLSRKRS